MAQHAARSRQPYAWALLLLLFERAAAPPNTPDANPPSATSLRALVYTYTRSPPSRPPQEYDLGRRLRETQTLLSRFSEENSRLAKENDRLRVGRQVRACARASGGACMRRMLFVQQGSCGKLQFASFPASASVPRPSRQHLPSVCLHAPCLP